MYYVFFISKATGPGGAVLYTNIYKPERKIIKLTKALVRLTTQHLILCVTFSSKRNCYSFARESKNYKCILVKVGNINPYPFVFGLI